MTGPAPEPLAGGIAAVLRTSVAQKAVLAASGLALGLFALGHLAVSLVIFAGPRTYNDLSAWLRTLPVWPWALRAVMVVALIAHVAAAASLAARNRDARPRPYHRKRDLTTGYAGRTMVFTGPALLLFLLYHVLHLVAGATPGYPFDVHNAYNDVVLGFESWLVSAAYLGGVLALGLHLGHGLDAALVSLGVRRGSALGARVVSVVAAVVLALGFASVPLAVMDGDLRPTEQTFCYPELAQQPGECGQP